MNSNRLNEAMAILQTMNMEDCAMEIQDLINELERVKGIAGRRLDRIAQLQHDLAVVEDKLEDTRSELRDSTASAHIAIGERNARIADLEALADNRLERIMNLLGAIDAKDFKTIRKDDELAAAVDPEQARVELGREPRSHLENELADLRASAFRSADAMQYIVNYCR